MQWHSRTTRNLKLCEQAGTYLHHKITTRGIARFEQADVRQVPPPLIFRFEPAAAAGQPHPDWGILEPLRTQGLLPV